MLVPWKAIQNIAQKANLKDSSEITVVSTIQSKLDELVGSIALGCKIIVPAGTYNEALNFDGICGDSLLLEGDTRSLAGCSWVSGVDALSDVTNAGQGAATISGNSGNNTITVTCATTNPDYTGWTGSDRCFVVHDDGSAAIYGILSVSSNVITLDSNLSANVNSAASVTLIPNRELYYSDIPLAFWYPTIQITIRGFYIRSGANDKELLFAASPTMIDVQNCVFDGYGYSGVVGASSCNNGYIRCMGQGNPVTAIRCAYGIYAHRGGTIESYHARVLKCDRGIVQAENGIVMAQFSCATRASIAGLESARPGIIWADYVCARNCAAGFIAQRYGVIHAENTVARCSGNTINYTPSTSDVQGNIYGLIRFT